MLVHSFFLLTIAAFLSDKHCLCFLYSFIYFRSTRCLALIQHFFLELLSFLLWYSRVYFVSNHYQCHHLHLLSIVCYQLSLCFRFSKNVICYNYLHKSGYGWSKKNSQNVDSELLLMLWRQTVDWELFDFDKSHFRVHRLIAFNYIILNTSLSVCCL